MNWTPITAKDVSERVRGAYIRAVSIREGLAAAINAFMAEREANESTNRADAERTAAWVQEQEDRLHKSFVENYSKPSNADLRLVAHKELLDMLRPEIEKIVDERIESRFVRSGDGRIVYVKDK